MPGSERTPVASIRVLPLEGSAVLAATERLRQLGMRVLRQTSSRLGGAACEGGGERRSVALDEACEEPLSAFFASKSRDPRIEEGL